MNSAAFARTTEPALRETASMGHCRPTLRALREDLKLPLPPVSDSLDDVDHPIVIKAGEQFADDGTPHERIRAVDDEVFFKVKVSRWRGAVRFDRDSLVPAWLVAAGRREDGCRDDFYAVLTAGAQAARARYNASHSPPLTTETYSTHLLPGADDWARYDLEAGSRVERRLGVAVRDLVRTSLRDGREHAALLDGIALGIQVRAGESHETYVAIRIIGSVPHNLTALILNLVPACDPTGWGVEYVMPDRPIAAAEQVWSNLMDPVEAAKIVEFDR